MSRNKYAGLLLLTVTNLAGCAVMIGLVVTENHAHSAIGGQVFLLMAVLNAITLLVFIRLIRLNGDLTESGKNFWTIVVFVALAAGQLAYLLRHVTPPIAAERGTRTMP